MDIRKEHVRKEQDSLGTVDIPTDRLWGAVTARALKNFPIGDSLERMPLQVIYALALVKKCSAKANEQLGLLSSKKSKAISQSADEICRGKWDDHFPLPVWQTGSGTASNMNVNEVIANRSIQILNNQLGDKSVHPNDDVNKCQSSNDVFPTAMHISAVGIVQSSFLPAIRQFITSLDQKISEFSDVVKVGRTHLMDAVPLTLGQEFSGYRAQLISNCERLKNCLSRLYSLPLGGTAVGTGLNAHPNFAKLTISWIAKESGYPFRPAEQLFSTTSAHDDLVELSGVFKIFAVSLTKIANDIRLMASGPRAGLNELIIPANEPGSSIMPGKTNPTQNEALTMVCAEVIANNLAVTFGGSSGHLELNTYKPLIIFNILRSIRLLTDSVKSFNKHCVKSLKVNFKQLKINLDRSLMMVTALNPHIGYDKAAQIAKSAYQNGTTLKKEALRLGFLTEEEFDKWVQPKNMTNSK